MKYWSCFGSILLLGVFCLAATIAAEPPALGAKMGNYRGIQLTVDGEPLSSGSRIITFAGKEVLFNFVQSHLDFEREAGRLSAVSQRPEAGVRIRDYTVRWEDGNAVIELDFEVEAAQKCRFEYAPVILPAGLISGAGYRATHQNGTTVRGTVPVAAETAFDRLPEVKKFEVATDLNAIVVEVQEGPLFAVLDRRKQRYASHSGAVLLITKELTPGKHKIKSVLKLSVAPAAPDARQPAAVAAPPEPVAADREIAAAAFPALPVAKAVKKKPGAPFRFTPAARAVISGEASERLAYHLERLFGLKSAAGAAAPPGGFFLEIGEGKGVPESPDGYTVEVDETGVRLAAATERGAFYALQTLRSLRRGDAIESVAIRDYPDFALRGLHTIGNSGTLEFWGELLETVAAPLKINTLLLECQYVQWERAGTPENPRGMSKADLAALIEIARRNYIEVIPLLQSLSHCQWMFYGGANLDLAEDPSEPYAYNASNPAVYELLKKVYAEVFELFPDTACFHAGHDELRVAQHKFPVRPENLARGAAEIFEADTLWQYRYLKEHGKRMMIWQDMLLTRKEARGATSYAFDGTELIRKKLPRDIVICIWNYKSDASTDRFPREFPEVDLFLADGYEVIGCTWYRGEPGNIENFSAYCRDRQVLGMVNTTWSHFGTETVLHTHFEQIAAHVTAAACFWNAEKKLDGLDQSRLLVELLEPPAAGREHLRTIPFTPNLALNDRRYDFDRLAMPRLTVDGVPFQLAAAGKFPAALAGRSDRFPTFPASFSIPVNRKFDRLYLLHTIMRNSPAKAPVCLATVRYADDSTAGFLIRNRMYVAGAGSAPHFLDEHGRTARRAYEVFAPTTPAAGYLSAPELGLHWTGRGKERFRLWLLEWRNPHPEREIKELVFSDFHQREQYFLLGLTGGVTAAVAPATAPRHE